VKLNGGAVSFVGPDGPPPIAVSGARVSTVNVRAAGVASVFPAASVARTSNVCCPSVNEATARGEEHDP
jgi:hypothetical protein